MDWVGKKINMNKTGESIVFYEKVFKLALPIAAQSMITIGVNMLDTMMVGKLGDNPLSATSLANSFISVYQIFCMGLGMGASVLVSRYWGMKQYEQDESKVFRTTFHPDMSRMNMKDSRRVLP